MSFKILDLDNKSEIVYTANEDMVEDIGTLSQEINIGLEAMSNGIATMKNLKSIMIKHNELPENIKHNISYCNIAAENLKIICTNIGLEPMINISVEDTNNDIATLSTEDIKDTIKTVIKALKKIFLKIVAKLKLFITKLIHNGDRLDSKLEMLRNLIASGGYENISNKTNDAALILIKKFGSVLYALDGSNFIPRFDKDMIAALIKFSAEYKASEGYVKLPDMLASTSDKQKQQDITKKFITDISTDPSSALFAAAFKSYIDAENNNWVDMSVQPIRIDGDTISGIVTYMDNKFETGMKFASYKVDIENVVMKKKITLTFPTISELNQIFQILGKPSKVLKQLSELGNADLKSTEEALKGMEKIANKLGGDDDSINDLIMNTYNVVPKVVNGNIINYYNNVKNILDFISTYIVTKNT